jgi:protein O-mannosyl-transferase
MVLTSQKKILLISLLLVVITVIGYEPIRHNDFVTYDDISYITGNLGVQQGLNPQTIAIAFRSSYGNYHPLTWLSHMLDCQLYDLNPLGHHLTNLLFHILNTLLLFWIMKRMTGFIWSSAFIAAVFALHPLHVESVAWASERKDVLSAFFFMLTILAYTFYVKKPSFIKYLLIFILFTLGLLSKSMLVTLPFVLLLLDYWPLKRLSLRSVYEKIPLIVLSAAGSIVTFIAQDRAGSTKMMFELTLFSRIGNCLASCVGYIIKTFYPINLAVLYPHPGNTLPVYKSILSLMILLVISIIIFLLRRHRYLAVGWLWFLGMLVPVIGLVQVGYQAMADRYTYLPSIGLYIVIAFGTSSILSKWQYKKILLSVISVLILASMCFLTRIQVGYWKNSGTLFGHALNVTENNIVMHDNMAAHLINQKQYNEAFLHLKEAMRIDPLYSPPFRHIGDIFIAQNKLDKAMVAFRKAEVLGFSPSCDVYGQLGIVYFKMGKYDLAEKNYKKAIELRPDHQNAKSNLAILLYLREQKDRAVELWQEVLELNAKHVNSNYNIGEAMSQQQEYTDAVKYFEAAIKEDPDHLDTLRKLCMLLTSKKEKPFYNPKRAAKLAQHAIDLAGNKDPEILHALSLALFSSGDSERAIETAEKAIEIANEKNLKNVAELIEKDLETYRSGKLPKSPLE